MPDTSVTPTSPTATDTTVTPPVDRPEPREVDGRLAFACPRCHREVTEELYGPCSQCRTTLRAVVGAEARDVDAGEYVPKMNVTPNAVATKD